jgi:peptide/nickel transport system substrate-binding protein
MGMQKGNWNGFWIIAVAGFVLAGCGKARQGGPGGPTGDYPLPPNPLVAQCEPGVYGGRLVVGAISDPKTFNPVTANESSSSDINRFLFGTLITMEIPTQEVFPGLAESWELAEDKRTWTFRLREGLRWSDGEPLTADDVVFTWDVIYDPEIDNVTADLFRIDGKNFEVTKLDEVTIRVVTPDIYAPFLEYFGSVQIIPKHVLSKAVAEKRFSSAYGINTPVREIVGSGPFKLKQFKPGEFTLLERNPYYWVVDSQGQRLPYLDNVIYMVVPDMNALSLRFLQGETDVHENLRPDEYDTFKTAAAKRKFQLLELGLGLERAFLWFNQNTNSNPETGKPYVNPTKLKWFRETKFRQAVAHAIDRDSIARSIYAGRAAPNYGYVSKENAKWNNPDIRQYPYDLDKARALLAEIGIRDRNKDGLLEDAGGNIIEVVLNTNTGNTVREKTAVLIADDLKKLGFKLTFQPVEFNSLVDKITTSYDYECILLGLGGGGLDPASSMNVIKSDGYTHQWFPRQTEPSTEWEARLDWLMNAQLKTLDFSERKKLFDEVQEILAEQVPMIYTVAPQVYAAVRADLGNVRPSVLSSWRVTWNAEELYFKK